MGDSPFNRLPAELRDNIYELVLHEHCEVTVSLESDKARLIDHREDHVPGVLGLPVICKAIRTECLPIYFSINGFHFVTKHFENGPNPIWLPVLRDFFDAVGHRQAREITRTEIDLGMWTFTFAPPTPPSACLKRLLSLCRKTLKDGAAVHICMQANFRAPKVDSLGRKDLRWPADDPTKALACVARGCVELEQKIKAAVVDPMLQRAYLGHFSSGQQALAQEVFALIRLKMAENVV